MTPRKNDIRTYFINGDQILKIEGDDPAAEVDIFRG